jgi:hypothetical protein
MKYAVVRAFKTPARRFHIGNVITADEIDGTVDADSWMQSGILRVDSVDEPVEPLTLRRGPNVPQGQPVELLENNDAV